MVNQLNTQLIGVQILRGIAALLVVFHHYVGTSVERGFAIGGLERAAIGNAGVDIFFVISGFIMEYTISARAYRTGDRSQFLMRRMTRILPLYWVLTLTAYLIATLLPFIVNSTTTTKQLMYSMVLLPDSAVGSYVLPSSWTLTFEFVFYLLFAMLLSVTPRMRVLVLALLFTPALVLPAELTAGKPIFGILLNPVLWEFLVGVLLAQLFLARKSISRPAAAVMIAAAIALLLHELDNNVTASLQRLLVWGIPATLMVAAVVLAPGTPGRPPGLLTRTGAWVGEISYSLYLSHFFAISMFSKFYFHYLINFKLPAWLVGLALFAFCLLVAQCCYAIIERPARNFLNGWLRFPRRKAPTAPAASA